MNKIKRVIAIVIPSLLALFIIGYYGINPLLNNILRQQVEQKLIGNFSYKYDTIQVNLLERSVSLKNVSWQFPKDSSQLNHKGSVEEFTVDGISWFSIFGKLSIKEISIKEPSFNTQIQINKLMNTKSDTLKLSQFNFYSLIRGQLKSVKVHRITVKNASAKWYSPGFKRVWRELNSGYMEIVDFHIDSITAAQNNGLFGLKDFNLSFDNAQIYLPDSLHKIELGATAIDFMNRSVQIDSLKLSPLVSHSKVNKKFIYEKTSVNLTIPQVRFDQVDFPSLFTKQQLIIDKISLTDMKLIAFKDKNAIEPTFRRPPLPQAILQDLSKMVCVDSVIISNASIVYQQRGQESDEIGKVDFDYLNATIAHITNDSIRLIKEPYAIFKFKTLVFDQSTLDGEVRFKQNSLTQEHIFTGTLQPMDLIHANKVLTPLKAYAIRSGKLKSFEFEMKINNKQGIGTLNFNYDNLKIDKLDSKTLNKDKLDNRIFSILVNGLGIQNANPDWKGTEKTGTIDFERNIQKSIFHYWWYTLLSGIQSIMLTTKE